MFKQVSPDIQVVNHASDICASSKRPIIYMASDGDIWEVSLQTHTQKLIYSFTHPTACTLACDEKDDLYIGSYDGAGECVHLLRCEDSWTPVVYSCVLSMFNGLGNSKVQYSYYSFSSPTYTHYSYVNHNFFFHWNGSTEKRYTLQGSIFFKDYEYVFWVVQDGDAVIFCLKNSAHPTQIWKTQGDHAVLLWYGGYHEPKHVTYSPTMKAIYGLSHRILDGKTYYHVSIYHPEVPSLFNICSSKITREKMSENVPPYLKDQIINPITERYARLKDKVSPDPYSGVTTDAQLREVYNNLPI